MRKEVITLLHNGVNSLLIMVLIFCQPVFGGRDGAGTSSETKVSMGPVGAIESLGAIRIDGRVARSGAVLWGNEMLEAPAIENAQVTLNEAGVITLSGGSVIKLASVLRDGEGASTLSAYLISGAMTIRLNDRANARICAKDSIFAFSPGSSARLLVSEGHGRVLSSKGGVKEDSDWRLFRATPVAIQAGAQMTPGEYKIEPYNFTFGLGGYADIEARSVRYLQFRVTDKDDKEAPDLALLILLKNNGDSSGAGSINYGATMMSVSTDVYGVVAVRFDAGVTIGAETQLKVIIVGKKQAPENTQALKNNQAPENTQALKNNQAPENIQALKNNQALENIQALENNQALIVNIRIVKPKGFWTLKHAGPVMTTAAVAAATAAVTAIAARSQGEIPTISPTPVQEPVMTGEPDIMIKKHRPPNEGEPECLTTHPPIRWPRKPPEAPHARRGREDESERHHSAGRGGHEKFRGDHERNRPHPPEPKSRRGGRRMFRGKFGITF